MPGVGRARKCYGRQYRDRYFSDIYFENDRDPFLMSQCQTRSQNASRLALESCHGVEPTLASWEATGAFCLSHRFQFLGMAIFALGPGERPDYSAASEKRIGGAAPDF